jgi:hypothetical protein
MSVYVVVGRAQISYGQSYCDECTIGKFTLQTAVICSECQTGTYLHTIGNATHWPTYAFWIGFYCVNSKPQLYDTIFV